MSTKPVFEKIATTWRLYVPLYGHTTFVLSTPARTTTIIDKITTFCNDVNKTSTTIKLLAISDRTDLSTESGWGPIQLARARYRTACRTVAESPPHCMNAPQQTHIPIKLCCEAWGREIADWQIDRRCRRSGVGRTPSHGLLMVMLIEIASVLCRSVSQEAVNTS